MNYYAVLKIDYSPANQIAEIKTTLQKSQTHLINIAQKIRSEQCCTIDCTIYNDNNQFVNHIIFAW